MKLRILIAGLLIGVAAFAAEAGGDLFQKATTLVRAGNLEEAIKLYQRVATEFASDRPLAAKALMAEAKCYETLGQDKADKATKLYEQVAKDFSDQTDSAKAASARLVVLRHGERVAAPVTMAQRKIELPGDGSILSTDGQRVMTWDKAGTALMTSDLAGNGKRVVFRLPKDRVSRIAMPSRDSSSVFMTVDRPDKTFTLAVVKTDGTGYHELAGNWGQYPLPCIPDLSWDNRSVLFCQRQTDGPSQLLRVSLADGEIRKLGEADENVYRFSPDGRFIAYNSHGKTFVMPGQGGESQLVTDSYFLDWTRDGRYLIVRTDAGGVRGLYLLPMKDGQQAGKQIFVRYGEFGFGKTTAGGAFIYMATPQSGFYTPWLGKLDPTKGAVGWEKLSLTGGSDRRHNPTWSPDSTQIAYVATNSAAGLVGDSALRVHNIASGEDRELYKGDISPDGCVWSAQRSNILCTRLTPEKRTDVLSISTDTGRAERLGTVPEALELDGSRILLARDERAIYLRSTKLGLVRWEIGAPTWTTVYEGPGLSFWPSPDERWVARVAKQWKVEIRPMSGGDWTPLAPDSVIRSADFTSDGNWLVFHGVDAEGKDGLFRVSTSGGQPERVGDYPDGDSYNGDIWISPDGQKFFVDTGSRQETWMLENFEPKQQAAK